MHDDIVPRIHALVPASEAAVVHQKDPHEIRRKA
jgi:hypothetical protein